MDMSSSFAAAVEVEDGKKGPGRRITTRGLAGLVAVVSPAAVAWDLSAFQLGKGIGRFTDLAASFRVALRLFCGPGRRLLDGEGPLGAKKASATLLSTQTEHTVNAHKIQPTFRVFLSKNLCRFRCGAGAAPVILVSMILAKVELPTKERRTLGSHRKRQGACIHPPAASYWQITNGSVNGEQ